VGEVSPALNVTREEGNWYSPAGPHYTITTARNMYAIAHMWTTIAPKVHEQYPEFLAEMFSYSIAAAHLDLPHQLSTTFMVSNDTAVNEGWYLIDKVPAKGMCD
jgi:methyl coenzyme M reductase alpha subunit